MDNEEYNQNQPQGSDQENTEHEAGTAEASGAASDSSARESAQTDQSRDQSRADHDEKDSSGQTADHGPYNQGPYNNGPYNQYDHGRYNRYRSAGSGMATAALVFGILSIVCFYIAPLAVILGALALIFAILSRGTAPMSGRAKAAAVLASCGMIVSCASTGHMIYRICHDPDLQYQLEQALDYYSRYYGLDLNDAYNDLFGYGDSDGSRSGDGHSYSDGNGYYYYYYYNQGNGAGDTDQAPGGAGSSGGDIAASLEETLPDRESTVPADELISESSPDRFSASWKGGAYV